MVDIHTIKCEKCGALMHSQNIGRYNKILIGFFIFIGAILCLTVIGAIIGIPIIIFAVKQGGITDYYWVCEGCGYKVKKHD